MRKRPWTAIISENESITAVNVNASIESKDAKADVEREFPGKRVVALIPGEHATYTHTFCGENKPTPIGRKTQYIDPFDTDFIKDF